ncbi:type II secretory pathway pseudopilin PulG [Agromyces sp. 3263]|uniref:hypothetical protein n=1 Tax=Agromyces sp. 3263 TaxID=2817750 RepID=UPI002863109B|nr:hypothetical protein [Agromyces sp. 3263]MDR6906346.1 type II secretory pathway pseudopilin PulG [Agromyces sp. 3263]
MDPLWWIVGLAVLAVIIVLAIRAWGRSRAPSEDAAAERAAQEQARLDQERRERAGPGEGSI